MVEDSLGSRGLAATVAVESLEAGLCGRTHVGECLGERHSEVEVVVEVE